MNITEATQYLVDKILQEGQQFSHQDETAEPKVSKRVIDAVKKGIKKEAMEIMASLRSCNNRKYVPIRVILYTAEDIHYIKIEHAALNKIWLFATSYAYEITSLKNVSV
jgi:exoribonuclease R